MRLEDFGDTPNRSWFQRLLELTRKRISFEDNIEGQFITAYLQTTETVISHNLGKAPKYIFEVASFPYGTAGIGVTKAPTNNQLFLTRVTAGTCVLYIV